MDQSTDSNPNQLALRVALQTMKERCVALQRRLTSVEEENQKLRECTATATQLHGGAAENFQLRLQVTDLQRQKTQLSEHINMVSNENRKLWSRLSQMAKEQERRPNVAKETHDGEEQQLSPRSGGGGVANQNLIRSKTFTQHSPNPHLRHKLVAEESGAGDISLEEVALGTDAYSEDGILTTTIEYAEAAEAPLGFAYLNEAEDHDLCAPNEHELSLDAKKYVEGLQEIRREALLQQQELSTTLRVLESRIALRPCPECSQQKPKKPEMADKSLETDDSLNEVKFHNKTNNANYSRADTGQTTAFAQLNSHTVPTAAAVAESRTTHVNIIKEKIEADEIDKTCPMCGRIYRNNVTFEAFREHVEMHFIDDTLSDADASLEHNFEMISHTVGDF